MTIATARGGIIAARYKNETLPRRKLQQQPPPFEIKTLENVTGKFYPAGKIPGRQSLYEIIWVQKGSGKLLIDMEETEVKNNMIYCIEPGQLHFFQLSEDTEGFCISFTADFLDLGALVTASPSKGLYCYRYFSSVLAADAIEKEMEELLAAMMREYTNGCMISPGVLKELLGILVIYISRQFPISKENVSAGNHTGLAGRFIHLLHETVTTRKTVAHYAGELAVSPNYLNQVMKASTGFTASYHIQQLKILEAKRQAIYFNNTLKEIAYYLGFDDLAHFSKFFKKNSGTNFREFKNAMVRFN